MRRSPTGTATGATPSAASARRAATRPAANSATRPAPHRGRRRPRSRTGRRRTPSTARSPTASSPAAARRTHDQSGAATDHTGLMADWMLDELAHAGQEHLDEAYVAGYEASRSTTPNPTSPCCASTGSIARSTVVDLGAGTGVFAIAVAAHCRRVVAVDVSPAMVDVLRRRVADRGLGNIEVVHGGYLTYEHVGDAPGSCSAATRCTRCRTSGRGSPSTACAGCSPRRCPAPARPRVRLRAGRGAGAHRGVAGRRGRRPGARAGRRTSSPSTCASSTARTAGCSSRLLERTGFEILDREYVRGAYGAYTCRRRCT